MFMTNFKLKYFNLLIYTYATTLEVEMEVSQLYRKIA